MVELAGALSEPRGQARWERLARRLTESPRWTPREPVDRKLPRRQGWVWPAIRRVLAAADAPMRPVAIYAAVVADLDTPISKSTIKNELRRRLTMSDLLGRRLLTDTQQEQPESLLEFAREHRLPEADVRMLASIRFRGGQPKTKERWAHIYSAIRQTEWMDRKTK